MSGFIVVLLGLGITVGIGLVIVILVAMSASGQNKQAHTPQRFRLPAEFLGHDKSVYGFFGHDDDHSHLATREQAAVTAMRDESYILHPQPRRHAAPSIFTLRPRTRHWKVPTTGTGMRTAFHLLFR